MPSARQGTPHRVTLSPVEHRSSDGLDRRRVSDIQRARILRAMVEVSAARGAGNVTVAHVVERAGVSRRTFYEIFDGREECFLAAFDEGIAQIRRNVLDTYDPTARWVERVRTALARLLQFLDMERGAGQLLIVGSLGAGAGALERRRHVLARVVAFVDEGRDESKAIPGFPSLTAEGVVGGVLSILHARLSDEHAEGALLELTGPLMGMIVLPYLGPVAARRELAKPVLGPPASTRHAISYPLGRLEMRLTYRTVRVLVAVAATPSSSNRTVAELAGIGDQGQISKLLSRLQKLGLVSNMGLGQGGGAANAWVLTKRGEEVRDALAT